MFEKNKTTQGKRSSGVLTRKSGHEGHILQSKDTPNKNVRLDSTYNRKPSSRHTLLRGVPSTESSDGDGETSSDDGGEGVANASEDEDNDEEPEALAPPVATVRASGLQTGRITSSIATATGKKRSWSTSSEEKREPRRPVKTPKSYKSKAKLAVVSDDDDYNGVDLISDSDEGEPDLEKLEERMIIDSEEENEKIIFPLPSPFYAPGTSSDDWQGFQLDDGLFTSDVPFFDDQIGHIESEHFATVPNSDSTTVPRQRSSSSPPPARRVRFADDLTGGFNETISTASSANDDIFPDLFLNQDSLDPAFRQLIENDNDDHRQELIDAGLAFRDAEEVDDFQLEKHGLEDCSSSEAGSSSGYESRCFLPPF